MHPVLACALILSPPCHHHHHHCRLRQKLSGATAAVRSLFGAGESQDEVVAKLEKLKSSIKLVKELFRDKQV